MPGRVRLHVPLLCRKRSLAETFLDWLGKQAGIIAARINYDCASLVLEYDPAQEPLLRAMLERFQHASLNDIKLIGRIKEADLVATFDQIALTDLAYGDR